MAREMLGSRLGFLFLSAGCAIGLGNIWRFPFIAGQSGGGAFVAFYILFLLLFGFPILVMELAVGRASQRNLVGACRTLSRSNGAFHWHWPAMVFFSGNLLLMMYYTTVSGWILAYAAGYCSGDLAQAATPASLKAWFGGLTGDAGRSAFFMCAAVAIGTAACAFGLKTGVERSVKVMMSALFALLLILAVKALSLPGAAAGLRFYLLPDFGRLSEVGVWRTLYNAMGQAFFTLSLGVGSMAIFGSYIGRERRLASEGLWIILIDTLVALLAGLIIFPVCFSCNVSVSGGPGLIFLSIPNIFNGMTGGRWWGALFFLFLSLAALTTVIAVFENLIAFLIDEFGFRRWTAALATGGGVALLSLPCVWGFNRWKSFQPLGNGSTVLDLEDFIVSQNLLPLGALFLLIFVFSRYGWGWPHFLTEADRGRGLRFPARWRLYLKWVVPILMLAVFVAGYCEIFG